MAETALPDGFRYFAGPYTVRLELDANGDWIVTVAECPGLVAHGSTWTEAVRQLESARDLWLAAELDRVRARR